MYEKYFKAVRPFISDSRDDNFVKQKVRICILSAVVYFLMLNGVITIARENVNIARKKAEEAESDLLKYYDLLEKLESGIP